MQIKESTFVVSGGASGLGEATVRRLHAAGANCLIADMNAQRGEALAAELGERVRFSSVNVTVDDDCEAAFSAATEAFGAVHGLVNCAGVGTPAKLVGRDGPLASAAFMQVINVNLLGTFNMLRFGAACMQGNTPNAGGERGVMINTASVAAFDGQIGQVAYAASKGGVVGMTLPIARELARSGIRMMTIAPGLFLTPMMESLPEAAQESLGQQVPFPSRLGAPDEFAQLVEQIVTNPMLNGETIRLDGAIRMAPK